MARPATGQIVERESSEAVSTGFGSARTVRASTSPLEPLRRGVPRARAESELANVLADVRRGIWQPIDRTDSVAPAEVPTFHVFASEWIAARTVDGLRPRSLEALRWALTNHLLRHFAEMPVDRITVESVDRYARVKAAEARCRTAA